MTHSLDGPPECFRYRLLDLCLLQPDAQLAP